MSCGEKDPFVDDTVIFAGRVRESKRMRKQELEALRRRNAKVSDSLRMTGRQSKETERILDETEEDWVRMAIIEGWSHGFLQMSTLMPEAREAIYRIGEWINDAFASHELRGRATHGARQQNGSDVGVIGSSETETDDAEGLMFVPRKKRTPPSSIGKGCDERGVDHDRSSDETLIGGGMTATTTRRARATAWEGVQPPGNRVGSPGSEKPLVTDMLVASPVIAAIGTVSHRQRGASPSSGKAALVPEGDLLKRRREEAVFGIGDVRAVEYPTAG